MGMCLFHEALLFKIHFYTLFGNDKVNVYCEPPATIRVVNIIPILQMSKQVLKEVKQFAQSHTGIMVRGRSWTRHSESSVYPLNQYTPVSVA